MSFFGDSAWNLKISRKLVKTAQSYFFNLLKLLSILNRYVKTILHKRLLAIKIKNFIYFFKNADMEAKPLNTSFMEKLFSVKLQITFKFHGKHLF